MRSCGPAFPCISAKGFIRVWACEQHQHTSSWRGRTQSVHKPAIVAALHLQDEQAELMAQEVSTGVH